jgi:transposase
MPKTRRRFTSEFKSEAVRLLAENGKPLQQVAAELGIHINQLSTTASAGTPALAS